MCYVCEMMLLEEHNFKDDPELVTCKCGVFRHQPESGECYHCYVKRELSEECPICDAVPAAVV